MRKISFAHIEKVIDFDNYDEACDYIMNSANCYFVSHNQRRCIDKPYLFVGDDKVEYEKKRIEYCNQFLYHTCDEYTYTFGNKEVNEYWSLVVRVPYKDYNPGW